MCERLCKVCLGALYTCIPDDQVCVVVQGVSSAGFCLSSVQDLLVLRLWRHLITIVAEHYCRVLSYFCSFSRFCCCCCCCCCCQLFQGSVAHDLLLPRCSVAVHHGGSGTTAAALRAGIPQGAYHRDEVRARLHRDVASQWVAPEKRKAKSVTCEAGWFRLCVRCCLV